MIKNCLICGKQFKTKQYQVLKGNGKYCSMLCASKRNNKTGKDNPLFKRVELTCSVCGVKYFRKKSYFSKHKKSKYCSIKCMALGYKEQLRLDKNPNWRGLTESVKCKNCGTLFFGSSRRDNKKYCSRKCMFEWKRKNPKTPNNIMVRLTPCYKDWRDKVFKRDNYTCKICGVKSGILNAHHLNHLSDMLKKIDAVVLAHKIRHNKTNELALWDVSNGITLCVKCHKLIHKKEKK